MDGEYLMRLRLLRKNNDLTMKELGAIVGVSESTISLYETGKREPDYEMLNKFADYFGVTVDYILGRDPINAERPALQNERDPKDAFTYAMQNECRDLTDEDKALLISMAKQLSSARKAKNGQTD